MDSDRQPGIRESDPEAMLGLVILVVVGLLVAMAVGVTLGLFVDRSAHPDDAAARSEKSTGW